jgi:large subunit ribosomal protein L11
MAAPKKKGKKIKSIVKLQVEAGKATPAPPLGPILGQNGVPIPEFVTRFNEMSKSMMGFVVPVILTVYEDRSFDMVLRKPPVASMIKNKLKIAKGSATPNLTKVGKLTLAQVKEIAQEKMIDLNTIKLESAMKIVEGTAKSLGVEVE